MIYTTGDSHAEWTFNCIPGVKVHSVSMITMKRIGYLEDNLIPDYVASLPLVAGDWLIMCAGEIDCRHLIKPQVDHRAIGLEELLRTDYVARYIERCATLPLNGAKLATCFVPPPVPEGKIMHADQILPVTGSNAERVLYVTTLNRLLKEYSAARGFPFIDCYDHYTDAEGLLRKDLSDGSVHIRENGVVREEMKRLGILA